MEFFAEQVSYSLMDEMAAHKILLGEAGAMLSNHQHAPMWPETYAYNTHLAVAAQSGELVDIISALLPCSWTYQVVYQTIRPEIKDNNSFLTWIQFYYPTSEDMDDPAIQTLFDLLDE